MIKENDKEKTRKDDKINFKDLFLNDKDNIRFLGEFIKRFDVPRQTFLSDEMSHPSVLSKDRFISIVETKSLDDKVKSVSCFSLEIIYKVCLLLKGSGFKLKNVEIRTPNRQFPGVIRLTGENKKFPFDIVIAPLSMDDPEEELKEKEQEDW